MNSRLDNIQAAVLLPKLDALKNYELEARQIVARRYSEAFAGKLVTPSIPANSISAWAQYALLAENSEQRGQIVAYLTKKNIPNMVYYPHPQHVLPVFQNEPTYSETFQNTIEYCARTFSLPMHPYLSIDDQRKIIKTVLEAL